MMRRPESFQSMTSEEKTRESGAARAALGGRAVLVVIAVVTATILPSSTAGNAGRTPALERGAVLAASMTANELVPAAELGAEAAPDRLIVRFSESTPEATRASIRRAEGLQELVGLGLIGAEVVRVHGRSLEAAIAALERHPEVEYVERDHIIRLDSHYDDETYFGQLWGLHNTGQSIGGQTGTPDIDINAPQAEATTLGDANLVVAVVDDGVDFSHPDLAGRQWVNSGETANGLDDGDPLGYPDDINGWDFCNDDATVHDPEPHPTADFHGTHVAGTIAGSLNGVGIVGVAPNVKVMALKFICGQGGGLTSDAVLSIQYARAHGADVINASWGGGGYSQALKDAIEASGLLFVASAGNGGSDQVGDNNDVAPVYPASYTSANIVSVAAIDNKGFLGSFSNYGATSVDISAPGVDILSSVPVDQYASGYAYADGTSMAAPHVSGVAALVGSVHPCMLSNAPLLRQWLLERAKPIPGTSGKPTVVAGMIDAQSALVAPDVFLYNAGYNAGYNVGFNRGFNPGYNSGYNAGFNRGYNVGFNDGYNAGAQGSSTTGSRGFAVTSARYSPAWQQPAPGEVGPASHTANVCDHYNTGYNTGYNDGFNTGFQPGYNSGFNAGFQPGYNSGFNDGYIAARR